jgi:hypothetical protein
MRPACPARSGWPDGGQPAEAGRGTAWLRRPTEPVPAAASRSDRATFKLRGKPLSPDPRPQPPADQPPRPADRPLGRRALFSAAVSGLAGALAACGVARDETRVVETPEGKVLQWERDDLLVLVSGLRERYRRGEEVRLTVLLNNQAGRTGQYRIRTKLAGRGEQVVVEAPVASLQVRPFDAGEVQRVLPLGSTVAAGEYTLIVELPPWTLEGQRVGGGALSAALTVD